MSYQLSTHQRSILERLAQGTDKYVLGYIPKYERAWLQDGVLFEKGLKVQTFNALRDNGWIKEAVDYAGSMYYADSVVYTISKLGLRKIAPKQERPRPRVAQKTLN